VIVPDVNLLIYAYDAVSRHHAAARRWWTACLNGRERVGIPPVVAFGFIRLVTHPRVFHSPMSARSAAAVVRDWLDSPSGSLLLPGPRHVELALAWLERLGTAGNLTTDVQLAAHVQESEAVLHTADTDFARFPGLRWLNPLTATS
jgi:toxin-antitoxin system PIN domain toxin